MFQMVLLISGASAGRLPGLLPLHMVCWHVVVKFKLLFLSVDSQEESKEAASILKADAKLHITSTTVGQSKSQEQLRLKKREDRPAS